MQTEITEFHWISVISVGAEILLKLKLKTMVHARLGAPLSIICLIYETAHFVRANPLSRILLLSHSISSMIRDDM